MPRHATKREGLRAQLRAELAKLSGEHRALVKQHMGNPPDVRNVPDWVWQQIKDDNEGALLIVLVAAMLVGAQGFPLGLTAEKARPMADEWARKRAAETAEGYTRHSRDRLRTWDGTLDEQLGKAFGGRRAEGIAVTEVNKGIVTGEEEARKEAERALNEMDPDERAKVLKRKGWLERARGRAGEAAKQAADKYTITRIWRHHDAPSARPPEHCNAPVRPCPVCSPLEWQGEETWPGWAKGGPPVHPYCDCHIEYKVIEPQEGDPT